jgi:hypothetical protein
MMMILSKVFLLILVLNNCKQTKRLYVTVELVGCMGLVLIVNSEAHSDISKLNC